MAKSKKSEKPQEDERLTNSRDDSFMGKLNTRREALNRGDARGGKPVAKPPKEKKKGGS